MQDICYICYITRKERDMELNDILSAITTVGFPIVVCLIVMVYVKYISDKNSEQIREITAEHKTEVAEMTKAIENNTIALTKLLERLGDTNNE